MNRQALVALPWFILAWPASAAAQAVAPGPPVAAVEEVIVTAQRRTENAQSTSLSIQVLTEKKLTQAHVSSFDDYAKLLPSLSFQTYGPGQAQLTVRGVTNGADGLSIGSEPTVGLYVDDIPVTTIANSLDPHVYDMERIEALSGPQGTLFGSASESGTVRLITNKPDPKAFAAGVDVEGDETDHGAPGGQFQGFVNLPITDHAAIRLVAYAEHDGGFIDNVAVPPTIFPTSGAVRDNAALARKDFNPDDVTGGRIELKYDLNNTWTILPEVLLQQQRNLGVYYYKPSVGYLGIDRYYPDYFRDRWIQAGLTVQGKIGRFELTYNVGYLDRSVVNIVDYSDYSYFYDTYYAASPSYFGDLFKNRGKVVDPSMYEDNTDGYTKQTHEIRLTSPNEDRLRFVAGVFYQRQTDRTRNEYIVPDLGVRRSITGLPGVNYMNAQYRVDRDYAAYAEFSFDILRNLTATAGARVFSYDNTVVGFFGYNAMHSVGEAECFAPSGDPTIPCINIDAAAKDTNATYKFNLTWKPTRDVLLYATTSDGFRPGGINRIPGVPPYRPDYLTNYEIGWKTSWLEHRLRFNGALFHEIWTDAQFGVTGPVNGILEIVNAGGAHVDGVETDVGAVLGHGLTLSGAATWLDAKSTKNTCLYYNPQFDCSIPLPDGTPNQLEAPAGTRLPVSARFKGNVTARWERPLAGGAGFLQATVTHTSSVVPSLNVEEARIYGLQPGYTATDLSIGFDKDRWGVSLFVENAFDSHGELDRTSTCEITVCGPPSIVVVPIRPRTFRLNVNRRF